MFPILLAFMVWLFAKGKFDTYLKFATTSNASPEAATTSPMSGPVPGSDTASGSSTPADLISGYTG